MHFLQFFSSIKFHKIWWDAMDESHSFNKSFKIHLKTLCKSPSRVLWWKLLCQNLKRCFGSVPIRAGTVNRAKMAVTDPNQTEPIRTVVVVGQTVLPDRSLLIGQRSVKNAKIKKHQMRHFWVQVVFENHLKKYHSTFKN